MEEQVGASTTSADQDERIRARRERVEKRNLSKSDEGKSKGAAEVEDKEKSRRKQQVASSLVLLDKLKSNTVAGVTSTRVEADASENARRIAEEDKRQRRLHALQSEALTSSKSNATVELRWAELMEFNMPLELNDEIVRQKELCGEILKSKDGVIKDFQRELKIKDEEYVRALKRQGDDVETLLGRMAAQYAQLQKQYQAELTRIEEAFLVERRELVEGNRAELDQLFEKRRVMELAYLEAKQEREAAYQRELGELRTRDAEDYNQLKIKLETDIQTLEQQLEEMRATYQLNTEKLEYNYRVLTERDMENSATLGQQKRKLARLKDSLSALTTRYQQADARYKQENAGLTDEYRRITKQYKDLQSKFRHFETADNKKYMAIWAMHREEVLAAVHRLVSADRVVQEQQLGHSWQPPAAELFESRATGMAHAGHSNALGDGAAPQNPKSPSAIEEPAKPVVVSAAAAAAAAISKSSSSSQAEAPAERSEVLKAKVQLLLELLAAEAGFLVDPKVKEEIEAEEQAALAELEGSDDESETKQEQDQARPPRRSAEELARLKADSILKALSIEAESDLFALLGYFFEKVGDDEEDAFALERAEDRDQRAKSLGLKIKPDEVVRAVRAFVADRNAADGSDDAAVAASKSTRRNKREDRADEEQRASDARRERDRLEEIEYWGRLADVVPDRTVRVWTALEQALVKYNAVLVERAQTILEVSALKQQNEELKKLLNGHLSKQVQGLLVPPLETMAVSQSHQQQKPKSQPTLFRA